LPLRLSSSSMTRSSRPDRVRVLLIVGRFAQAIGNAWRHATGMVRALMEKSMQSLQSQMPRAGGNGHPPEHWARRVRGAAPWLLGDTDGAIPNRPPSRPSRRSLFADPGTERHTGKPSASAAPGPLTPEPSIRNGKTAPTAPQPARRGPVSLEPSLPFSKPPERMPGAKVVVTRATTTRRGISSRERSPLVAPLIRPARMTSGFDPSDRSEIRGETSRMGNPEVAPGRVDPALSGLPSTPPPGPMREMASSSYHEVTFESPIDIRSSNGTKGGPPSLEEDLEQGRGARTGPPRFEPSWISHRIEPAPIETPQTPEDHWPVLSRLVPRLGSPMALARNTSRSRERRLSREQRGIRWNA
jgi:hypothetical protein